MEKMLKGLLYMGEGCRVDSVDVPSKCVGSFVVSEVSGGWLIERSDPSCAEPLHCRVRLRTAGTDNCVYSRLEVRKLFVGQFDLMEDTSSVVQDRLLSNNTNSYFYFVSEETGGVFSVFELCEEILSVGDTGVNPCAAVCVSLEPFREDSVEFDDPDTVEGEECVAPSVETSVDSHVDEGVGGSMPPVYEPVVADEYIRVDSSLKELFEVERSKYELVQEQGVVSNSQFLYELLVRNRTLVLSEQGIPPRLRVSPLED